MRSVFLGSHIPRGRCVSLGSQHWSRRAADWVFTCPTLPCTLWENTAARGRKLVLVARGTLRNDQDSPSGLQMCMPSASPGLDMLPGRWVVHSSPHWPRRALRQLPCSLTALRAVRENTVSKAQKSLSVPRGDVTRPPGLSGRTANVYAECFSRFRDAAGLLCVA